MYTCCLLYHIRFEISKLILLDFLHLTEKSPVFLSTANHQTVTHDFVPTVTIRYLDLTTIAQ